MAEDKFKLENLVVLQFSSDILFTEVVDAKTKSPKELKINLRQGTWTYHMNSFSHKGEDTMQIGESGFIIHSEGRVIGVYDRTNNDHLNSMVHAGKEATTYKPTITEEDEDKEEYN